MKKFLIAGSSLVAVGAAGTAGAVDVTLGGSIDMSVEYGMKEGTGLAFGDTAAGVSLSIAAAGTTDGGVKYGGSFSMGTQAEIKFNYYENGGAKYHFKNTVEEHTNLQAAAYNVSGGNKLNADAIVSVKINSEWMGVNGTKTAYSGAIAAMTSTNICKIAGRVATGVPANAAITRLNAAGTKIVNIEAVPAAVASGYLPAGRVAGQGAADTNAIVLSAATSANSADAAVDVGIFVSVPAAAIDVHALAGAGDADKLAVGISDVDGNAAAAADFQDQTGDVWVADAAVYAGPFAEVRMQSSTTKMVVGAVCLTGKENSDTAFYMDNASNVVTASGAKIFVDGGFGKLTLQTSDYAGKVSAIGEAGDEAGIGADGLVAIVEGSAMGASVYGAVDLAGALTTVETVIGASFDLSGLSIAVDYESTPLVVVTNTATNATTNINGSAWDIGASYSMGDMTAGIAFDSDGDFGASADMSVAGLNVGVVLSSRGSVAHEKTGLDYSVTAGTSLNGMSVSVALDQDMKIATSLGYDIGDLNIYAGYDAADNGGKVGAKLSF